MKTVVMAGGEGTRLRPLTIGCAKPMLSIVNKPVIEHIFDLLKRHGVTEVIVTTRYMADTIYKYFSEGTYRGLNLFFSEEDTPLGTAGGVKRVQEQLADTFLVISGDAMTDFDLSAIIEFHRRKRALATMTLYRVPNPLEYGVVVTDEEGRVKRFLEKPGWGEVISDTVNTGIYVLEPEVLDYCEANQVVDFSQHLFPLLFKKGAPLWGYVAEGYWCDVGNIREYMRANEDVLNGKVRVEPLGKDMGGGIWYGGEGVEVATDARLQGPIWLGEACKVMSGAAIYGPSVVQSYTFLDRRARVERSIIGQNSFLGELAQVRGAIVGRLCNLKSKVMVFEEAVIGDGTTVGEGAIIRPNVKVWPSKEIEAGATVSSSLVWGAQGKRVLFGKWGVAGLVNVDLTPEFAARLGVAYGSILPQRAVVTMNREPHRTPRIIKRAMISGLPSAGINVLDIKTMPLPVARYITRTSEAVGGVHVRLSPFDTRVVEIKFFDEAGLDVSKNIERKIESSFFREDYRRVYLDDIGTISETPYLSDRYTEAFLRALGGEGAYHGLSRCSLVIDYGSSPASLILPTILNRLGYELVSLNASVEEERLIRSRQEIEEAMHRLAIITSSLHIAFGARLDPAGEKIFAVDERGQRYPGWKLLGAVTRLMLQAYPGGKVALPATAPRLFEQVADEDGGEVVRTGTSPQALMAAATRDGVVLVGDGGGGFIFPQLHPVMDGLYAIVKIRELLARQGVGLGEVADTLPRYYISLGKVPCAWENKGKVMRQLSERYRSEVADGTDGIRIDLGREWVLVLPSVDEPLFHIYSESTSNEGARILMEKYSALVDSLQR